MSEMKWIRTEDQLPETDEHVLCCTENKAGKRNVVRGYYMDGLWRCGMNSNVTHWMPMPEPPGEDGHDTETTGHWEERIVEDREKDPVGLFRRRWYCSACGDWQTYGATRYCPDCGAKMEEET